MPVGGGCTIHVEVTLCDDPGVTFVGGFESGGAEVMTGGGGGGGIIAMGE